MPKKTTNPLRHTFYLALASAALGTILLCGCAGGRNADTNWEQAIRSPKDPFVVGPTACLLTNQGNFSAKVVLERAGADRKSVTGHLVSRENSFVFSTDEGEKKSFGETSFIWNATTNAGFILNDTFQAYAPIKATAQATNISASPQPSAAEKISGHATHLSDVTVYMSDGSQVQYNVWKADDLNGFPMRITAISGIPRMTVTFSDIRPENPPISLFQPPEGFTRYESRESLLSELLRRQSVDQKPRVALPEGELPPPINPKRTDQRY